MEIVVYEPINEGDYSLIERSTDDSKLIAMWCSKRRRSDSGNTTSTYYVVARQFVDAVQKPIQALTYTDLASWANQLQGSINTKRSKINAVKSLFGFAHKLGYIRVNPAAMIDTPIAEATKHRKMLSEEEIVRLVSGDLSKRDEAILRVLYSSGMRVSELINLRWRDIIVQGDKAILVIRGKGGKTREAGISDGACVCVWFVSLPLSITLTEHFRLGSKLYMNLKTDNGLIDITHNFAL
jgi:integrase/recombinase XerD